jgi:rhodanese-related sulfurtransferase
MNDPEPLVLLDVREPEEHAICHLTDLVIPLGELERRAGELDRNRETVVYCHHGIRSKHAAALLRHHGFARVRNLSGGIDRWACEIDKTMRRY